MPSGRRLRRSLVCAAAAAGLGMLLLPGSAPASTIIVDDDEADCRDVDFNAIQPAVDAAAPGDAVLVCEGVYPEQVRISGAAKRGLTLVSETPKLARIEYPQQATAPEALVHIANADRVRVQDFLIAGPFPATSCDGDYVGIHVQDSAGALIDRNWIVEMHAADPLLHECPNGRGVVIETTTSGETATGRAVLSVINGYQQGGVDVSGPGARVLVALNSIEAAEEVRASIPPYGVQVSEQALGTVVANRVSGNRYEPPGGDPAGGHGILTSQTAGVLIRRNNVSDNDDNIRLVDTDESTVDRNTASAAVKYDGIHVDADSSGNTIADNTLTDNAEHDCHDDSTGERTGGTANTWSQNEGGTANRAEICPGAVVDPPPEP